MFFSVYHKSAAFVNAALFRIENIQIKKELLLAAAVPLLPYGKVRIVKKYGEKAIDPVPSDIYAEMQKAKTERIFTQSYNAVRLSLKSISQKLGFAVSAHILRHTYATRLEEAGISPKIQQYLLGHSKVDISQNIYTDAQNAYINSISDKICGIFDTK